MSLITDKTVIISGGAGSGKTLELQNYINHALASNRYVYLFDANGAVYGDYKHHIILLNGVILTLSGDINKDADSIGDNLFVAFDMTNNHNDGSGSGYLLELCRFLQNKHKQAKTKATIVIEEFWQYSRCFSNSSTQPIIEIDNLKNDYINFILSTNDSSVISSFDEQRKKSFLVIEKKAMSGAML